jgi:hypothetical protein
MELVGDYCRICAGRIEAEAGADGCLDCEQPFHVPCLPDARRCPSCDRPFQETRAKHGITAPPADRAAIERGKRWMLTIVGLVLTTQVANALVSGRPVASLVPFAVSALLLYFLYKGFKWARVVTVALMGLGAIFVVLATLTLFQQPNTASKVVLLAIAAVYVLVPCLLIGSSDLTAFLEDQHAKQSRSDA